MGDLVLLIVSTILFLGVMYLIRGLVLWYYQITKRVELMEETNNLLRKLLEKE
ncbi:hypothetical protein D9V96_008315 [Zobellia laminariae]|uniref:hypothetical protein n=1 Tax=Zobellia laminariae TaxID=248906 RepID=UPI0012D98B89